MVANIVNYMNWYTCSLLELVTKLEGKFKIQIHFFLFHGTYIAYFQDLRGNVKGFMLSPRVDTTGAGDAFVGALLFSLAKDTLLYQVHYYFLVFPPLKGRREHVSC